MKGVGKYNNPEVFPYICEHPLSLVEVVKYKKIQKSKKKMGQWWCILLISAFGRYRQADFCEFEAYLDYKS